MSLLVDDEILDFLKELDDNINDLSVEEICDLNNCDLLSVSDVPITEGNNWQDQYNINIFFKLKYSVF